MKKKFEEVLLSLIPAIIFLFLYKMVSFRSAVVVGFLLGGVVYTWKYVRYKKLMSFDYLGMFSLIVQSIVGVLAENPKTYFI